MQALILAAGMGRRLGHLTEGRTKCMLSIHGKTLIEHSLDALTKTPLTRVILVVGYAADGVQDLIGDHYNGVPVTYVTNDDFATTNNIYSLFLARHLFSEDDTLLLESDLIYDADIIPYLVQHPAQNAAVVAKHRAWMDGTVVTVSPDFQIQDFIPKAKMVGSTYEHYYKTVNIYKFSRDYIRDNYTPFLEAYVRSMGRNEYYEQVLRVIAAVDQQNLSAVPLTSQRWYEIDDLQDYEIAQTLFAPTSERYQHYLNRHGGYWRFPDLLDFCYLVNPYFPPPTMRDEIKRSFDHLLCEYPSSARVQNHLAAKMFDCSPDNILVGNGAAELIVAVGQALGSVDIGVPVPTFEEYLKRFDEARVHTFTFESQDFRPDLDHLKKMSEELDVLILVNPDNPSGQALSTNDVLELAAHLESAGKRFILDESFVDFADPAVCSSLINQEVLERYPHLVIIKSISKSYGVPGARLGVLATLDQAVLSAVKAGMPVWNINSFGEYFLQVIGKYHADYVAACSLIRSERARFFEILSEMDQLHVIPSQSNYFLCDVRGPLSASEVAHKLLLDHAILVKDASKKPGLERGDYLRIAIRGKEDNDALIDALRLTLGIAQHTTEEGIQR